jgi:uncharacterized protein
VTDQTPPPPPSLPAYGPGAPYSAAAPPLSPADEKLWATLVHIGGIFLGWVAPLIGYLVLKDRGPFVRAHTATALNFHLTMLIGYVIGFATFFVLIGFFVFLAIGILTIVCGILAAVAANNGQYYTYPLSIKFLS